MMFGKRKSLREVIDAWSAGGRQVSTDEIEKCLHPDTIPVPWYVHALAGLGAWIAAWFLILFIGLSLRINDSGTILVMGLCGLAASAWLYRVSTGIKGSATFLQQLSLAISIAGIIGVVVGSKVITDSHHVAAAIIIALELALFALNPDPVRRFISTLIIPWAFVAMVYSEKLLQSEFNLWPYQVCFILLLASIMIVWEFRREQLIKYDWYRVLRYGLIISLVSMLWITLVKSGKVIRIPYNPDQWFLTTAAVAVCFSILIMRILATLPGANSSYAWFGIALVVITAVLTYHSPGVLTALFVLVLAYAHGNRILFGLAAAFLAVFMSGYYYHMNLTLLQKSIALMATGVLFLAALKVLNRLTPSEEQA